MQASSVDEKAPWDDDEPAPDSSVRPTVPPNTPRRESVKIGSFRPREVSTVSVTVSIGVSPALMASAGKSGWYLTLSRMSGEILFEGALDEMGTIDALVAVPCGTQQIKALIESATKYKEAVVLLHESGYTAHAFA